MAFLVREPSDLFEEFRTAAREVHLLGWKPHGFIELFWRTFVLLHRSRPRGIVCYTVGHHVPVALAAWFLDIPNVLHLGNMPPAGNSSISKLRLSMRAGDPFVTTYVACSNPVRERAIVAYNIAPQKIHTVLNGIDLERFEVVRVARPKSVKAIRELRIGMVASLEPSKDHETLLHAVARLNQTGLKTQLILIGDGSLRARLQSLAELLDLDGRVEWRGSVSDVVAALRDFEVFAFSTTASEGLGIALIEALAAGLPVIASDLPACRAALEDGRWGILVPRQEPELWANAIRGHLRAIIPAIEQLRRYDISQTFHCYHRLMGSAA